MRSTPGAILLALLLVLPQSGWAQESPEGEEERLNEAIRLSEIGRLHYEGGEFAQAAAAFSRAWELHPDPVLGYNAARSYENTGELERAVEFYQATLDLEFDDEGLRQRCRDGITRVENILSREASQRAQQPATLVVQTTPEAAQVWVDDQLLGPTPLEVQQEPGEHLVRLELAEYQVYQETVQLQPGATAILRVVLTPLAPPPAQVEGDTSGTPADQEGILAVGAEQTSGTSDMAMSASEAEQPSPSPEIPPSPEQTDQPDSDGVRTSTWVIGILGGVGTVSILLAALAGAKANEQYDLAQSPDVMRDTAEFDTAVDEGIAARDASNFLYLVGIASVVTAVVLYFVLPDDSDQPEATEEDQADLDPGIGIGLGPAGLVVTW